MNRLRTLVHALYPIALFLFLAILVSRSSHAGRIRKIALSTEKPSTIYLLKDHATAISFLVKPERVVPGAQGKVEILFIGNDVQIIPHARDLGNLHIYTKSQDFVILLQHGTPESYDDKVEVTAAPQARARPIRLAEDSYRTVELKLSFATVLPTLPNEPLIETTKVAANLSSNDRKLEGAELADDLHYFEKLKCEGCTIKRTDDRAIRISCVRSIDRLTCQTEKGELKIEREGS